MTVRILTETGILVVLEGKHYENIDLLSPRFGEIVGVCCGKSQAAPVTDGSTQYAYSVRASRKDNSMSGWLER